MLLKWLFTALAILWLIQALRPYFVARRPPRAPNSPPRRTDHSPAFQARQDDGEYIDYEEIK